MAEYIDCEALLDVIDEEIEYESPMYTKEQKDYIDIGLRIARKDIEFFPTSDVAPVKHGKWDDSFDGITPYCTICGKTHNCMKRTPPFCPNCGARMDGDGS